MIIPYIVTHRLAIIITSSRVSSSVRKQFRSEAKWSLDQSERNFQEFFRVTSLKPIEVIFTETRSASDLCQCKLLFAGCSTLRARVLTAASAILNRLSRKLAQSFKTSNEKRLLGFKLDVNFRFALLHRKPTTLSMGQ